MAQPKAGPLVMPWEKGHPDEVGIYLLAGLFGAIIGATLVYHYRHAQGRA